LEAFFEPLGLSSLVAHFAAEAVDLQTMLDWEDPRTEIKELGILQRGVVFKIAKALEAYKDPAQNNKQPQQGGSLFGGGR
jgi:hypothetical protein